MDSKSESTMDSIDVTIFEDFYHLDITLPFVADPPESEPLPVEPSNHEFLMPAEQTFSVFTTNLRSGKTPAEKTVRQPLIIFSPAATPQQQKSFLIDLNFSPVIESVEMKENQTPEPCIQNRPETPTDLDKTLVLKQISARTNQSPLYTPVTAMVSRFRNLALDSPFALPNIPKNSKQTETTVITKETTPNNLDSGQHQTRLEKVKLISPLLRSPKFRPVSTRLPFRSNSKVTNTSLKTSPTVAQYKANPPVNQGSRIPVLKLI